MKKLKSAICGGLAAFLGGIACIPASAESPHWTHEEQSTWGAAQDTSQTTAPLMYPYAECSLGTHQSPVNLTGKSQGNRVNTPKMRYTEDKPDFFNNGHAVQVNVSTGYQGRLLLGRESYPLVQYHFHAPSEHTVGGKTYIGELHFVHVRVDGKIAVLGVLLQEGEANLALQTILDNTPTTTSTHNRNSGVKLNPMTLLPKDKTHFYTYAGSLTTPPCNEGVDWYVLTEPVRVSAAQIAQLQSLHDNNNREPQDLNGRTVTGRVK